MTRGSAASSVIRPDGTRPMASRGSASDLGERASVRRGGRLLSGSRALVQSTVTASDRKRTPRRPRAAPRPRSSPNGNDVPRDRPRPQGRQALHLRVGRRHGRGRRRDEGPARRQGRRARRDDEGRPADPARLHDHDRSVQRLLRRRREAARRAVGRRPRGDAGGRGALRQGLRRPEEPAPRERPLRRQVLDARDDGHRPQPRPQRGDAPGPRRADRQRAIRLGRVPPVHRDVRADRDGRSREPFRRAARGPQGGPRSRREGHRPRRGGPEGPRR